MRKHSGHPEPWGQFVDVKVNAPELLKKALRRKLQGEVILSSVTDPYQPLERSYALTRACLDLLSGTNLGVRVLTKSDLVTRDLDIFKRFKNIEVGLTVTTDSEDTRQIFEPHSAGIRSRVQALRTLRREGISTSVFIGPILPMDPERLVEMIAPFAQKVLIDRMNYQYKVRRVYKAHGLAPALQDEYFEEIEARLLSGLSHHGISATLV
jgi:DNA repair photolyase